LTLYNSDMRLSMACVCLLLATATAQNPVRSPQQTDQSSVTVPMTLDHNRVMIDVEIPQPDGANKRVQGWVNNGDPDQRMSQNVAAAMGLSISCDGQVCSGKPNPQTAPFELLIGGMRIRLSTTKEIKISSGAATIAPGTHAQINIPSAVLRNYDVLIDFPGRELTIAEPGSIRFNGAGNKVQIDPGSGRIRVPSQIENKKYNLALDLGSPISSLSGELFDKLAGAHPDWPHMTGAIGPANLSGEQDELNLKLMRLDRIQFGSLHLIDVPVAKSPTDRTANFQQQAGAGTIGLLGADVLLNYRVGIDHAHSMLYFDIGRTSSFPEFDVVGLTLRPDNDRGFTVVAVAEFNGKSSVPNVQLGDQLTAVDEIPVISSTMGQVWAMLRGSPGQERKLTIERGGKQLTIVANVEHFLAAAPDDDEHKHNRSGH
jgi:hypothetical protein